MVSRCGPAGTGTLLAGNIHAQPGISVISVSASVAIMPGCLLSAVYTGTGLLIANVRVSVALAGAAIREPPFSRLTLIALSPIDAGLPAAALSSFQVAEIVQSTHRMALAEFAALRTEAVGSRRAFVASSTNDILSAFTLTSEIRTNSALGPRRVTATI